MSDTVESKRKHKVTLEACTTEEGFPTVLLHVEDGKTIAYSYYTKIDKIENWISYAGIPIDYDWVPPNVKSSKHLKNVRIGEALGVSGVQFKKHFNALMYKTFVASLDNLHVKKFALNPIKKKVVTDMITVLHKTKDKLDQVKKDNIYHIAPFVFQKNKTPSELKAEYGKGLWKTLCKNSFSKNKVLSRFAYIPDILPKMNSYPVFVSNALDIGQVSDYSIPDKLILNVAKGLSANKNELKRRFYIMYDTCRMAQTLGEKVSSNLNFEELNRLHDSFAEKIIHKRYSADNFNWLNDLSTVHEVTFKDYKAILLTSAAKLVEEGDAMRHCVGSYAGLSSRGVYAVYSVLDKEGNRSSTIGFNRDVHGKLTINQHYKKCNMPVTCEDEQNVVDKILYENKKLLKNKEKIDV